MSSLRWKWMLVMALVAGVPLAGLAVAALRVQGTAIAVDERVIQVSTIDQTAEAVGRILDDAAEVTHRTGKLLTEPTIVDDDARMTLARETVARSSALRQVAIYRPDGELLDAIQRAGAQGERPAPPLPPMLTGQPSDSGGWLPTSFTGPDPILRYVEPCVRDGVRRAWVEGVVTPGVVSARLEEIARSIFNRDDHVFLIDE